MNQSEFKSRRELKYLARSQMSGHWGLLIGTVLLPTVISFLAIQLTSVVTVTSTATYIIDYVITFIVQVLVAVLDVGASLIFLKCACNMPAKIGDLFHGYQNNLSCALFIGFVFVLISSICSIPCDIMSPQLLNATDLILTQITEESTLNEAMLAYSTYYSVLMSYYVVMFCCSLVAFLIELMFMPAYYLMLDYPDKDAKSILKLSIEIMKGNKLRYVILQLSFLPLLLLGMLSFGIGLIWVLPYMNMTKANFYLDIMAVRNRNMNKNAW